MEASGGGRGSLLCHTRFVSDTSPLHGTRRTCPATRPGNRADRPTRTTDVLERELVLDADEFDQVVGCPIAVESRAVFAAGITDYHPDAARIKIYFGSY